MPRANNWSESEVEAAVEDYFDMLCQELRGQTYSKAEHRRQLKARLSQRSDSSIEFKHPNISAVLIDMGLPYIDGYQPRANYQRSLVPAVENYLRAHPEIQQLFMTDADQVPTIPSVENLLEAMEMPPQPAAKQPQSDDTERAIYNPAGVNYLAVEAQNQQLGEAGEQFVLNFERARLIHANRTDLADQIEQVSATIGPSAGFDIHSYEYNGTDRFIEVKTTKYGKSTPFFVTPNEMRFSQQNAERYRLYRVFEFRIEPRVFVLRGDLQEKCLLKPSGYQASVR